MPQVKHSEKSKVTPRVVGVLVLVVLAVATAGGAWWWEQRTSERESIDQTRKVMSEAFDKAFAGDDDAAIEVLERQLARAKTEQERADLNMELSARYESKEDYANSLKCLKAAERVQGGFGINEAMARVAEKAGDKALALEKLKANRELIKAGKGSGDSLPGIEEAIKRLEGGQ